MSCRRSRQNITARRLRSKLQKSRESLADQFEFKMFIIVHFKTQSKKSAVFEIEEVHPLMTNDCEHKLMQRANQNEFSVQSAVDLFHHDVVQLHARKWQSRRRDVIGCSDNIDFMIYPRNDICAIQCRLFSRWKHETSASFRPFSSHFTIRREEYETKLELDKNSNQTSCVVTNSEETMFLFLSQHHLDSVRGLTSIFRINSVCVYIPQAELMNWGCGTMEEVMDPLLENI